MSKQDIDKILADCIQRLSQPSLPTGTEQEFSQSLNSSSTQVHAAIDTMMGQVTALCLDAVKRRTKMLHDEANERYVQEMGKVKDLKPWLEKRDDLLGMCQQLSTKMAQHDLPPENLAKVRVLAEGFAKEASNIERSSPCHLLSLKDTDISPTVCQKLNEIIMNIGSIKCGLDLPTQDDLSLFSDCISLGTVSLANQPKISIDFTNKLEPVKTFGIMDKQGPELEKFNSPRGVIALPGGFAAVADSYNNRVKILDLINMKEHQCLMFNIERAKTISSKQLTFTGVAFDHVRSRLLIADSERGSVFVVDVSKLGSASVQKDGNQLSDWPIIATLGQHGFNDKQFNVPYGLCVDPRCEYAFICDSKNHQIKIWNLKNGQFVQAFGDYGKKLGQFCEPCFCAMTEMDQMSGALLLAVSDSGNDRIQHFKVEYGTPLLKISLLRAIGKEGSSLGLFSNPRGLAFDQANGNLIVADSGNKRVQVLSKDGTPITAFGQPIGVIPEDVAIAYQADTNVGSIIVTDRKSQVVHIF